MIEEPHLKGFKTFIQDNERDCSHFQTKDLYDFEEEIYQKSLHNNFRIIIEGKKLPKFSDEDLNLQYFKL